MDEQFMDLGIKVSEGDSLSLCLEKSTKARLKQILTSFDEKMPSNAKKQEMADKAEQVIKSQLKEYFDNDGKKLLPVMTKIDSGEIKLSGDDSYAEIKDLFERGFVHIIKEGAGCTAMIPADIEKELGLSAQTKQTAVKKSELSAQTKTDENDDAVNKKADELYGMFNGSETQTVQEESLADDDEEHTPKAADNNRTEIESEIIKYAHALANIYGIYNVGQLKEVWDFNHKRSIAPLELNNALQKAGDEDGFYIDGMYLVNTMLKTREAYCEVLEKLVSSDVYYYPSDEVIDNYLDGPVYKGFVEYRFIRSYISQKLGGDDEKTDALIYELMMASFIDKKPDEVVEIMKAHGILFENAVDFDRFTSLYISWFYNMRSWACKGYMMGELRVEKAQYRNFHLPANIDPRKKKKIGRNDPCPCGSGIKFKNCCGKER